MSPHNVLVGVDGVARVLDFGIAKAGGRVQVTRDGQVKGKLSYLAPEQLTSEHAVDRRTDIYAAAATLWEGLTGRRLVQGDSDWQRVTQICAGELVPPSLFESGISKELDAVVMKGLAKNPADRYATAREMALALEVGIPHASPREVGDWVEEVGGDSLRRRAEHVAAIESHSAANSPASYADEPTLTRSDVGAVIIAESSANRNSAPAAMARSLSSNPPPPARATMPSIPTGSGARSVRVALSASVDHSLEDDDALPKKKRAWVLFPLLLVLLGGTYVAYMRFAPAGAPWGRGASPVASVASPVASSAPAAANAPSVANGSQPPAVAAVIPSALPSAGPSASATSTVAILATATPQTIPAATPPAPTAWKAWKPWSPPTSPNARPAEPSTGAPVASGGAGTGASAGAGGSSTGGAGRECDVPYTIDTQGIRHPKPQCL
jgi:serine/threonine-protein kinase